ncbi:hypothetical protein CEQ52_16435 [Enterobacter kobei]|nr:hypothetical protein CEQ52_16435 [Enterobacter kobei]
MLSVPVDASRHKLSAMPNDLSAVDGAKAPWRAIRSDVYFFVPANFIAGIHLALMVVRQHN